LAGFQVIAIGRFWVITEAPGGLSMAFNGAGAEDPNANGWFGVIVRSLPPKAERQVEEDLSTLAQ
jgi:hypothetical protein